MYLNFYQLNKKPFSLAPDPEFLYLSQQHKEALGAIIYGIKEREGFVSVIGEVGTGKTTIIRSYLQNSDRNKILPVFIFNTKISFSELLETFLREIGIESEVIQQNCHVNDMVRLAYEVMLDLTSKGKTLVLIIDEAQNMPIETLGNLCLLSNFESVKTKLIQIVLVGQPELKRILDLYELRQLRQRIAYKAVISPLSKEESDKYLRHRLALSSKGQKPAFTESAIRRIINHSKGVPRVINVLSENALVAGYGSQEKPVSLKLVKQVIAEYEGKSTPTLLSVKRLALPILALLLGLFLVSAYSKLLPGKSVVEPISNKMNLKDPAYELGNSFSVGQYIGQTSDKAPLTEYAEPRPAARLSPPPSSGVATHDTSGSVSPSVTARQLEPLIKIVKRGDTLSELCVDSYGFYNMRVFLWLQKQNSHIANLETIQSGDIIYFPAMEPSVVRHLHELHRSL